MVPFLYPRKGKPNHKLPHSQAFSNTPKHTRHDSHSSPTISTPSNADTADLDTYTASLHRWTLCQLQTSFPKVPSHNLSRHCSSTTFSSTPTIVSPLYPKNSSFLYNCSIRTPKLGDADSEDGLLGDTGTTPCNTLKQRGLRRRSTVVAAKGGKVNEEIADEGERRARLRPVELRRSLSCAD